jgi:hypothetical protein
MHASGNEAPPIFGKYDPAGCGDFSQKHPPEPHLARARTPAIPLLPEQKLTIAHRLYQGVKK